MAVVVFHLWPTALTGGFVGVDVFFVISGFLITGHLVREIDQSGTVRLGAFWGRRIRRLLPAAFTVLVATAIAALIWLPGAALEQTFREISASALYVQNWLLAGDSIDYLAAENGASPVQHYWSLSLEEQFYVVWPLLLLAVVKLFRRRRSIVVALIAVFALSLAYSVWLTEVSPGAAYFVTPTRMWEFAVGGLLVFAPVWRGATARIWASWIGVAAIGYAMVTLDGDAAFPGAIALIPVLGVALVIWAGESDSPWATTAFARLGPVGKLGELSYGIYLWHWPLIVLYPVVRGHAPEQTGGLVILVATIALAWATQRFIEEPVRTGVWWNARLRRSYGLAAAGMVLVVGTSAGSVGVMSVQLATIEDHVRTQLAAQGDCFGARALSAEGGCLDSFASVNRFESMYFENDRGLLGNGAACLTAESQTVMKRCEFGAADAELSIALVGNSHAAAIGSGLAERVSEHDWRLTTYLKQGCQGVLMEAVASDPPEECLAWTRLMVAELRETKPDLVLFQSYAYTVPKEATAQEQDRYRAGIAATWDALAEAGVPIAVVSDVPGIRGGTTGTCSDDVSDPNLRCAPDDRGIAPGNGIHQEALAQRIPIIDLQPGFCLDGKCPVDVGGVAVYFDLHHLTHSYAETLTPLIFTRVEQILQSMEIGA